MTPTHPPTHGSSEGPELPSGSERTRRRRRRRTNLLSGWHKGEARGQMSAATWSCFLMLMSSAARLRRSCWRNALGGLACSDRCDSQVILGDRCSISSLEVSGVFGGEEAKVDRENLKKTHRSNKVGSKQRGSGGSLTLLCRRLWDRARPRGSGSAACLPLRGPGQTLGPSTCRRGPRCPQEARRGSEAGSALSSGMFSEQEAKTDEKHKHADLCLLLFDR